jgi:hypothetical protein
LDIRGKILAGTARMSNWESSAYGYGEDKLGFDPTGWQGKLGDPRFGFE